MKTIADLNARLFYRLLKVIFFGCLVLIVGGVLVTIWFAYAPEFDNKASYATCTDGRRIQLEENDVVLYGNYVNSYADQDLRRLCLTDADVGAIAKKNYSTVDSYQVFSDAELGKRVRLSEEGLVFIKTLNIGTSNYELVPVYTPRDWTLTVSIFSLVLILSYVCIEFVRRVFYYIVLGRVFPAKK